MSGAHMAAISKHFEHRDGRYMNLHASATIRGTIELLPRIRLQLFPDWTRQSLTGLYRSHYGVGLGWLTIWLHVGWTSRWHAR